ncbi:MAG: hypothetical protein GYA02_15865 [Clostridiaceae bacterium]|nr:hypothetical protein [Clostridiaceae bacterium]
MASYRKKRKRKLNKTRVLMNLVFMFVFSINDIHIREIGYKNGACGIDINRG